MRRVAVILRLGILALTVGAACGQPSVPAFGVTSVIPRSANTGLLAPKCAYGRLISVTTMYGLIRWAYNLQFPQTTELDAGLPGWTKGREGVYTVEAVADGPASEAECRVMLQTLLADRFKLRVHWENKDGSIYELVAAPRGHRLQRVADGDDDQGVFIDVNDGAFKAFPGAPRERGWTMERLARFLGPMTQDHLTVIDKTGLDGEFKINLTFSTDPLRFSAPDLATAMRKQLGLRLERHKGPVQHFVLDGIERPDPN